MQLLAVLFNLPDPINGLYNQFPLAVLPIKNISELPNDGQFWIAMTQPALDDYIVRVHFKNEPTTAGQDPYQVAYEKVQRAKEFGLTIIDEAAAENISLGLNTAQVMYMLSTFAPVISMLMTGSLSSALVTLQHIPGNANVPQARINTYIQKIQNYLNSQ